ncbi:ABC transporter ATP-binding protein [Flavihumibacter sp. ZG627]|uniref:ABC transporter ATP-binding protein n=1 Tax=Flavihumibacter sp. ZG627 TaxID=1463156 RepID=UPI0005801C4A|nr:ATP-binding cassette domain-containing protein [Flavihumibacter sp. ZG627]KIC90421.1 organic solvent ABC transporter ATP-binding protein [Flavihumibacter sp. ZG627]
MEERSLNKTEVVISIRKLYKAFGTNAVLKGFDLDLNRAENLAVLGKSGSGKSVLIKCIIGLLKPDSGIINVFNESIPEMEQDELDHIRARIGFLFQSNALYDSMTVRENLAFPLRRHWIEKSQTKELELIEEALENVGLAHTLNMMPVELSGGMRKRIALARTLILRPEIILYDEPTTGLDPITGKEISELMVRIQEKYKTSSIIISHDMNCIKITADRITLLTDGIAYATGSYDELKASDDPVVKQFFD